MPQASAESALTLQDLKPGKGLVIDRCKTSGDNLAALTTSLQERGYHVHISGADGGVTAVSAGQGVGSSPTRNILAMLMQRPSCTVVVLSGSSKATGGVLPQYGAFTVYYYATSLQRLPFSKGQFSQIVTLEDDEEQTYSRMAKAFVATGAHDTLQLHDLNMLLLVLHHNLMHCQHVQTADLVAVLKFMAAMEPMDDQYTASLLQCQQLARLYRKGPPLERFEFTQHLSRFSHVVAAQRRARTGGWEALRGQVLLADQTACVAVKASLSKGGRSRKGGKAQPDGAAAGGTLAAGTLAPSVAGTTTAQG